MATFKQHYRAFRESPPGRRFTDLYERRKASSRGRFRPARILIVTLGLVFVAAGFFFLVMPGPGLIPTFIGFALLSMESRWMARWLDRGELLARKWGPPLKARWERLPSPVRWAVWLLGAGIGLFLSGTMIRSWLR